MTPRPKKILSALVAALATVTMVGAGSAAAKAPEPPQQLTKEASAASDGTTQPRSANGPFTWSFKPRR